MISLNRAQLEQLYKATEDEFDTFTRVVRPNGCLLDVGTGGGRYARAAYELGFRPVYGMDVDSDLIAECNSTETPAPIPLHFIVGDILNPPEHIRPDTIVMMADTLNFIVDKELALLKCKELLPKGGCLYISASNKPSDIDALYGQVYTDEQVRILQGNAITRRELEALLERLGLVRESTLSHTGGKMFLLQVKK